LFSHISIGTVAKSMSVAAFSVARFPVIMTTPNWMYGAIWLWCEVNDCSHQVQHHDTSLFNPVSHYNTTGASLMGVHSSWLAAVLWQFDTTHFILTVIEMNMILFQVWRIAQIFCQNVWEKGDKLKYPGIEERIILNWIFNQ
jgi:hypothetical protein